jgi:hypothetical protein
LPGLFGSKGGLDLGRERGRAINAHFQCASDIMMQSQFDIVLAKVLDRVLQMNLALINVSIVLVPEFVGDCSGGHGAEHLSVLAGLDGKHQRELGKGVGQFGHGAQFLGLAVDAAFLETFEAALVGGAQRNGESLGEQKVSSVAGGDLHLIGFGAEAYDVVSENDFSFRHFVKWLIDYWMDRSMRSEGNIVLFLGGHGIWFTATAST